MSRKRSSNPQVKITFFTALPLHKTSIENADKFIKQIKSGQLTVLQPPFGTPRRLAAFPKLVPAFDRDLVIVNDPHHYSTKLSFEASMNSPADIAPFAKMEERRDYIRRSPATREQYKDLRKADLQLNGRWGICDLVFSGIGWAMISGKFKGPRQPVTLRIWTPKGQGAMIRDLCLLPELAVDPLKKTAGGVRRQKLFQDLPKAPLQDLSVEEL